MITTEEILRILECEEIPDGERDKLETLLLIRADEALEKYAYGKKACINIVTSVTDIIDFCEVYDKMKETGSTDIESIIQDIVRDKVEEISGTNSWFECDID